MNRFVFICLLLCSCVAPAFAVPQANIGGSAVSVPMTTFGGPNGTELTPNYFRIDSSSGVVVPSQLMPAAGSSVTVAGLVITNTGTTSTVGPSSYVVLSVQAVLGATAGNLTAGEWDAAQGNPAYASFAVAAASASSVPAAPAGFAGAANSAGTALVWTWYASSGATSYNIYRGASQGTETILASGITALTYSDSAVAAGTKYWYYLTAVNSAGTSTNSSEGYLTVPGGTASAGSGGGTGTPSASGTGLTAALTWNKGVLTITYAGTDSFVQCSWPGGSYTAGDGQTLTTPAPRILNPAPPVGSSIVIFGKNTTRMVLVVHDDNTTAPADNVTTTAGGDGYVPVGVNAPKHDPGSLKIGFGKLGSISLPSGWWSEIINFATQAAMEAEGMTGPQISAAMTAQTIVINSASQAQHSADRADADNNAANNQADADHNAYSITNQVVATEQQWKLDFVSTTQSIYTPQPSTIGETQNLLNQFLTWGPYQFVISAMKIFQQTGQGNTQYANQSSRLIAHDIVAPGDQVGPISIHVPGVAVDSGIRLDANGNAAVAPAGVWYDSGLSVPFQFESMTHAPAWPIYRLLVGGSIHIMFIGIFIKWFLPKAHF